MSRLIRIHNDTYDYLKFMGRKGETFDDVIIRLLFDPETVLERDFFKDIDDDF